MQVVKDMTFEELDAASSAEDPLLVAFVKGEDCYHIQSSTSPNAQAAGWPIMLSHRSAAGCPIIFVLKPYVPPPQAGFVRVQTRKRLPARRRWRSSTRSCPGWGSSSRQLRSRSATHQLPTSDSTQWTQLHSAQIPASWTLSLLPFDEGQGRPRRMAALLRSALSQAT